MNAAESKTSESTLLIFSAISTACILGWLLAYSHYGIDFTDEGFYLTWISNPFVYDWSTTQFGFIYHPLYQLLKGNIAALRQVNILVTFFLAWFLVDTFFRSAVPGCHPNKLRRLLTSSGIATVSMAFLNFWLPTPSYNSLTLQALLVTATGLLLANATMSRSSILGWTVIGFGGWLTFMAKPSTAVALGICTSLYLSFARKLNFRLILVSIGIALLMLILSAIMIDGSAIKFINRIKIGIEFYGDLGGGHTLSQILRLDDFYLNSHEKILLCTTAVMSFIAARLACAEQQQMKLAGLFVSAIFFTIVITITLGKIHPELGVGPSKGLLIWAIPLSVTMLMLNTDRQKYLSAESISQYVLALLFISLPHVYAFGTNGNYWHAASSAGLFWVLGGLALGATYCSSFKIVKFLLPLSLASQAIVAFLVQTAIEAPYRQPQPLRLNHSPVEIGAPNANLILTKEYGAYINEAIASAKQAKFAANTPVIDLSGQSPSILYAMNALPIGQPWTIGGYPGSQKVAIKALKIVPCDQVAAAWLLIEPAGPLSISAEVLTSLGASLSKDYELVATWETPEGAGGFKERRTQKLFKPSRDPALAAQACMNAK